MSGTQRLARVLRPLTDRRPALRGVLRAADGALGVAHHGAARLVPGWIQPSPRQLTLAVTASCNLRCKGCRYGRDFMVGERLSLDVARQVLEDAAAGGVNVVRLYGGEPLLHPDLPEMIRHGTELGLEVYVTTNGTRLAHRIDELVEAGLKWLSVGYYGSGDRFDAYTGRPGLAEDVHKGLQAARERHGDRLDMQLNYVLVRPLGDVAMLREAWQLALAYDMHLHVDLAGWSIPFFSDGPDDEVPFHEEDRPNLEEVARELLRLKREHPERVPHHPAFLRSIPDWLLLGARMRVPCDAYQLLWIGADGSVQLCDVSFPLGNVNETRLSRILFGEQHKRAARDAFRLKCPNCTCKVDSRVRKDPVSRWRYRK